jgi:tRNA (cmo5U34)-methyltransferase
MEEINGNWLVKYKNEDNPAKIIDQIFWLKKIGLKQIDVIWKYYNFAVYGGKK